MKLRSDMITWGKAYTDDNKKKFSENLKEYKKFQERFTFLSAQAMYSFAFMTDLYFFHLLEQDTTSEIVYVYTGLMHAVHMACFMKHRLKYTLTHQTSEDAKDIFEEEYKLKNILSQHKDKLARLGYKYNLDTTHQCTSLDSFPANLS